MLKKLILLLAIIVLLKPLSAFAATKFLEPGGDAIAGGLPTAGFWKDINSSSIVQDIVHGGHLYSTKVAANSTNQFGISSVMTQSGTRIDFFFYMVALPTSNIMLFRSTDATNSGCFSVHMTSAGVLQLWNGNNTAQVGSNGATLSTGQWYRISLSLILTNGSTNQFKLFVDGASSISVTNVTIGNAFINKLDFYGGSPTFSADTTFDARFSDFYVDNSNSMTDPGNIWVTAKRPNANGTTNGFTTQIGSGGSGYGSGHSPQVNERPLSITNGWSVIGAGSAVTEEYNIESASTGDIDISGATIVDWLGWVSTKSLAGETANVIIDGSSVSQAITTTNTIYTKIKGSSVYPSGTGADIGMQTDTSLTTVSLYEAGVMVAYIPNSSPTQSSTQMLMASDF